MEIDLEWLLVERREVAEVFEDGVPYGAVAVLVVDLEDGSLGVLTAVVLLDEVLVDFERLLPCWVILWLENLLYDRCEMNVCHSCNGF